MTRTPAREELFIERVRETVPEAREVDDTDLLAYGEATCKALEGGVSIEELATAVGREAGSVEVAAILGQLGGIATITLCPEVLENGG